MMNQRTPFVPPFPSLQDMCSVAIGKRLWECFHAKSKLRRPPYVGNQEVFATGYEVVINSREQLDLTAGVMDNFTSILVLLSRHVYEVAKYVNSLFHCPFDFDELPTDVYGVINMPKLVDYLIPKNPPPIQYHLATIHCLEGRIRPIWDSLPEADKLGFLAFRSQPDFRHEHVVVNYWTNILNGREAKRPIELLKRGTLDHGYLDAYKYFWKLLSVEEKGAFIRHIVSSGVIFGAHGEHHVGTMMFFFRQVFDRSDYTEELLSVVAAQGLWGMMLSEVFLQSDVIFALFESAMKFSIEGNRERVMRFGHGLVGFLSITVSSPGSSENQRARVPLIMDIVETVTGTPHEGLRNFMKNEVLVAKKIAV